MTTYSREAAEEAAKTNSLLRVRLMNLEEEEENQIAADDGAGVDTTVVDNLKSKNNSLRSEVSDLQRKLGELKCVNVTELYHQFVKVDNRRAYLQNETAGLRNILENQKRDVARATRVLNAQQDLRRQNEENNASTKEDTRMLRERREKEMSELNRLTHREAELKEELSRLYVLHDPDAELARLHEIGAKRDRLIEDLKAEIAAEEANHSREGVNATDGKRGTDEEDIAALREEYVRLKGELASCGAGV